MKTGQALFMNSFLQQQVSFAFVRSLHIHPILYDQKANNPPEIQAIADHSLSIVS